MADWSDQRHTVEATDQEKQTYAEAGMRMTGQGLEHRHEPRTLDAQALGKHDSPDADPITTVMSRPLSIDAQERLDAYRPPPGSREVVYLSTPITTGPLLLEWLAANRDSGSTTDAEIVRDEVISQNVAQLDRIRGDVLARLPEAHLIDPTTLSVPGWTQWEYHRFWVEVIDQFVDRIVFADGWDLSTGCTIEYATGLSAALPMEDQRGMRLRRSDASHRLRRAVSVLEDAGRDSAIMHSAAERAEAAQNTPLKDDVLAALATEHNVASFVSLAPNQPRLRHRFVRGSHLSRSAGVTEAVQRLLSMSVAGSVNVRTFRPDVTKGNPFLYGLTRVEDVLAAVNDFASQGLYCIVNETIAIDDGGVSGVTLGGVAEFAPDDTPRVVEKAGTASMPVAIAQHILERVYGSHVIVPADANMRIEFSVHPNRVGYRSEHVIVWETESSGGDALDVAVSWPNDVSRLLGDKTFGLLVADALGIPVPSTTAITRRVAPFQFGRSTGTGEWWMRTAPATQAPGHYTTTRGWSDPFAVLIKEDVDNQIAAVLAQEGVDAIYSGATLPIDGARRNLVEGVRGDGANFMLGDCETDQLPDEIQEQVTCLVDHLEEALGFGVRIEWAHDGNEPWVLQLHRVETRGAPGVFSAGNPDIWLEFDPSQGLDTLSELIAQAVRANAGIEVTKPVGLTSHVGDLLRKARVPGRLSADAELKKDDSTSH